MGILKKFFYFYIHVFFLLIIFINILYVYSKLGFDIVSKSDRSENKKLLNRIKTQKEMWGFILVSTFLIIGTLVSINAFIITLGYSYEINYRVILILTFSFYFYYFTRIYLNIKN